MRVTITAKAKRIITIAEMPIVKRIITEFKEDETTAREYASIASRMITGDNCVEVINAEAQIAKNCRIYNQYGEDSADFDIWIDFRAYSEYKDRFIIGGAYLSDICNICGIDDINEEIKKHMYIRSFLEEK